MKKNALFLFALLTVSLMLSVCAYSQEDMVEVSTDGFDNPQRPPAVFRHDEHNEKAEIEECNECHHVYDDGKLVEDDSSEGESCSDCHELHASSNTPGLMKAYHLNCIGCHEQKKKGPVMCGQCHVRRPASEE